MEENNELKQANKKLEELSQDEHMRRIAEWRESAIWEHNAAINTGYNKGVKQEKRDIAIKLLKKRFRYKIDT